MPNDIEAEVKHVHAKSKADAKRLRRDPSMTGGEKAETPAEKENRHREKLKPKEPPIIQKDVT